jgi:hypothetical protein
MLLGIYPCIYYLSRNQLKLAVGMVSLITLFDGNFGTENSGEESYLQLTIAVTFPFHMMTKQAPTVGLARYASLIKTSRWLVSLFGM